MHFAVLLPHSKDAEMARTNSSFQFQDLEAVCLMGMKGLYLFILYIVENNVKKTSVSYALNKKERTRRKRGEKAKIIQNI